MIDSDGELRALYRHLRSAATIAAGEPVFYGPDAGVALSSRAWIVTARR